MARVAGKRPRTIVEFVGERRRVEIRIDIGANRGVVPQVRDPDVPDAPVLGIEALRAHLPACDLPRRRWLLPAPARRDRCVLAAWRLAPPDRLAHGPAVYLHDCLRR